MKIRLIFRSCTLHSLLKKVRRLNIKPSLALLFQPVAWPKRVVNAEVEVMRSMSAHGDADDLCRYLSCQETDSMITVFLVHGEYNVQHNFAKRLMQKGYNNVLIPEMHTVCGLNEITAPEAAGQA